MIFLSGSEISRFNTCQTQEIKINSKKVFKFFIQEHDEAPCEQSLLFSFSLLREKEALPESRQLFEAATARTCGLVNLVFSLQTGFSSVSICLVIKPMVIILSLPYHDKSRWLRDLLVMHEAKHQLFSTRFFLQSIHT